MNHLPNDINTDDIQQWLGRGWCNVWCDGQLCPAQYNGYDEDNEELSFFVSTVAGGGEDKLIDITDVHPHWPQCGATNLPGRGIALYVQRRAVRQWRRTYNGRCVTIHIPDRWDLQRRGARLSGIQADTMELVHALFNPVWYKDPLGRLSHSQVHSVAITPQIIISGDPEAPRVHYRGKFSGVYEGGELRHVTDVMRGRRVEKALRRAL